MAFFNITTSKKGVLQAKIQASGKDTDTDKNKLFTKRVYNTENLSEAKFRRFVEKAAIEFEEEVKSAYERKTKNLKSKVLTYSELMEEWLEKIKNNLSLSYYIRAKSIDKKFTAYLKERNIYKRPISEITVRDVELFLNSFARKKRNVIDSVNLIKDLPKTVNFRELEREKILARNSSYGMRKKGNNILKRSAIKLCEKYNLDFNEYFHDNTDNTQYSVETIKGYRRVLRTLFNEAVRYEWITKNPVCATKVCAGNNNTSLRPVSEKEVFTIAEAKRFIQCADNIPDDFMNRKICFKLLLLTGIRTAELCGLYWSDIDLDNNVLHVRRNRLYSEEFGIYEKGPKSKTSLRDIPLTDALIKDLKKYKKWFKLAYPDFEKHPQDFYIAANLQRLPLFPQSIGHWLKKFEKENDLKLVSCHGLRHTYCSLLLSQNVPIQTVSKYLGHSDSTVTLKVYSHFIPDTQAKALYVLDKLTD